ASWCRTSSNCRPREPSGALTACGPARLAGPTATGGAPMPQGPLIILSGPSGVGKSTVIRRLLAEDGPPLHLAVSATTRAPPPGERDGVDYFFWTAERFQEEIDKGGFLEWAEVHGTRYGTLGSEVDGWLARGRGVLLDIDVQGAEQVRRRRPGALSI